MAENEERKEVRLTISVLAALKPLPHINFCDTSTCHDRMENQPEPIEAMPSEWLPRWRSETEHIHFWINHCDSTSCPDRISKVDKNPSLLPKKV